MRGKHGRPDPHGWQLVVSSSTLPYGAFDFRMPRRAREAPGAGDVGPSGARQGYSSEVQPKMKTPSASS